MVLFASAAGFVSLFGSVSSGDYIPQMVLFLQLVLFHGWFCFCRWFCLSDGSVSAAGFVYQMVLFLQVPPQKSEAEIQEEEELQLALAISKSEAESKEKEVWEYWSRDYTLLSEECRVEEEKVRDYCSTCPHGLGRGTSGEENDGERLDTLGIHWEHCQVTNSCTEM